jgi:hypothetical protein
MFSRCAPGSCTGLFRTQPGLPEAFALKQQQRHLALQIPSGQGQYVTRGGFGDDTRLKRAADNVRSHALKTAAGRLNPHAPDPAAGSRKPQLHDI